VQGPIWVRDGDVVQGFTLVTRLYRSGERSIGSPGLRLRYGSRFSFDFGAHFFSSSNIFLKKKEGSYNVFSVHVKRKKRNYIINECILDMILEVVMEERQG
jgi:hypothetical protein